LNGNRPLRSARMAGVQQDEQSSARRSGHRSRAREQPQAARRLRADPQLGQVGLVLEVQRPVVGLDVHARGGNPELGGHVLDGGIEPVGLGQQGGDRVLDGQASCVLAVVRAPRVEDVVLVDELARGVDGGAPVAGRLTVPVARVAVDSPRGIAPGGDRRGTAAPGRRLPGEDGHGGAHRSAGLRPRAGRARSQTHRDERPDQSALKPPALIPRSV